MTVPRTTGVRELSPYHPPLEGRADVLRLDFNEWVGSPHPRLETVLRDFPAESLGVYPEDSDALVAVADQFGVEVDNLVLSNGTDEAICNVYRTFLPSGERVLVPDPGYTMMEFYATLCEASVTSWELDPPQFTYDWAVADQFCTSGGRVVTVARPNNPTGSNCDHREVLAFADRWPDRLVLVDEAYAEFTGSSLARAATETSNLLVLRTFSKAWSMAGLRVGAVVGSPDMIADLRKMWSPYSVNALGLHLVTGLLPDRQWPVEVKTIVDGQRERLRGSIADYEFEAFFGEANFFLLKPDCDVVEFCRAFSARGIRLRDQSSKRGLKGWVRISIGDDVATDKFLSVLDEVCDG